MTVSANAEASGIDQLLIREERHKDRSCIFQLTVLPSVDTSHCQQEPIVRKQILRTLTSSDEVFARPLSTSLNRDAVS